MFKTTTSQKDCHVRPAGIYLLNVNNGNTRTMCEICSKLRLKILAFIINFE